MPLSIPSYHRDILVTVSQLNGRERSALLEALGSLTLEPLSTKRLATDLADRSALSERDSDRLLAVLTNLHTLSIIGALDKERVIPEVLDVVEREKDVKKSQVAALRGFLVRALKIRALGLFAKALNLYAGHGSLLSSVKIFTDLRPVFEEEISDPSAFLVSHTLRLAVHRGTSREPEEIHIALDKKDLEVIAEVIKRAHAKQSSLEKFAQRSGIATLALED